MQTHVYVLHVNWSAKIEFFVMFHVIVDSFALFSIRNGKILVSFGHQKILVASNTFKYPVILYGNQI